MMRAPSGIVLSGEPVGVAAPVPALVVVQHPVGDRLDAEALEHPVADLRVPLEHEPLRLGQRARLAEDLLRDRELAEVVQAAGEPGQLDLLGGSAELRRDPAPRAPRPAPSGCRCRRRASRPRGRATPQRESARRGRRRSRPGGTRTARRRRGGRGAPGSCRAPSPSRARRRRAGSASRARGRAAGTSRCRR